MARSIIPGGEDQTVHLVLDDYEEHRTAWRETDVKATEVPANLQSFVEGHENRDHCQLSMRLVSADGRSREEKRR